MTTVAGLSSAGSGAPTLEQWLLLLAVAAVLPFAAWFAFERLAAVVARVITLFTGRRDPVVARPRGGGDGMIGEVGVVRRPLAPRGKVFVRGELWDAEPVEGLVPPEAGAASMAAGCRVRVEDLRGLVLRVRPLVRETVPERDSGADHLRQSAAKPHDPTAKT